MAFFAGVKVQLLDDEKSIVTVKYRWLTKNPFRSMYFACEAMAAEMATALPVLNCIYKNNPAISMLIVSNQASYFKKATGKISFKCEDVKMITENINKLKNTKEAIVLDIKAKGFDEAGDCVAEFYFAWSLKSKA
jgi:hypothetical protein